MGAGPSSTRPSLSRLYPERVELALTAAALVAGLILVRSGGESVGGTLWESYRVTLGGLVIYTVTSPCGEVSDVDVIESDDRVEVTVHVDHDGLYCADLAVERATRVELAAPLGDRPVYDGSCLRRRSEEACRVERAQGRLSR